MRKYVLILASLLFSGIILSQNNSDLSFVHLTRNDGLLHNNVTSVRQDSLGYVWIGTHRGLNRYDGYKIDAYRYAPSDINSVYKNRIYSMEIVRNILFMATEAGLVCFDICSKKFLDYKSADNELAFYSQVDDIKTDHKNRLWLISRQNAVRVVEVCEDQETLLLKPKKIGEDIEFKSQIGKPRFVYDEKGNIYLFGKEKLSYYFDNSMGEIVFGGYVIADLDLWIQNMVMDNNKIWVCTSDKLQKYALRSDLDLVLEREISFNEYTISMFCIDKEFVWIVTNDALLRVQKEGESTNYVRYSNIPWDKNSISNDINNIYIDNNKNIWAPSWDSGLSYTNNEINYFKIVKYDPETAASKLKSKFISSLHYNDGHVYIGSKHGGISRFNIRTKDVELFVYEKELMPSVTSIISDNQNIYAAVSSNIVTINKRSKRIEHKMLASNYIFCLTFDKYNRIWAATAEGLDCFIPVGNGYKKLWSVTTSSPLPLSTNLLHGIYSDLKKNELIITSASGINRVLFNESGDIKDIVHYKSEQGRKGSLSSDYLWPIDKENDSVYWVGSLGSGLNKVTFRDSDGNYDYNAECFGMESGAPSDDIESIEIDKYGNIWCGGYSLTCFNPNSRRFNTFDMSDGLQSYMFATSSSCKDMDSNLYFGGAEGMNYFTPQNRIEETIRPSVSFSRIYINGKLTDSDIEYASNVVLKHNNNNFSIDFSPLLYKQGKHIRYRYQLEGYDQDWRYIEMGEELKVSYHKVPYGKYTLVVNSRGWEDWDEERSVIRITILPPFWLSWWAITIYCILLTTMVYFISRSLIKWLQMKQTIAIQKKREEQNEEIMQMKIDFFTDVAHEFRTPLTLINTGVNEIEESDTEVKEDKFFGLIKKNTNKLLKLINELLDFHRFDIKGIRLNATNVSATDYFNQLFDEFSGWAHLKGIRMETQFLQDNINVWLDEEHLSKVISNIISNSIKNSKQEEPEINIAVSAGNLKKADTYFKHSYSYLESLYGDKHLIIKVRDNGVGIEARFLPLIFDRFFRISNQADRGSGIGLALVRSIIRVHCGGLIISSEPDKGTEFIIGIPLDDSYLKEVDKSEMSRFNLEEYLCNVALEYEESGNRDETDIVDDNKPTILLVDDNKDILMALKSALNSEYNILTAQDGEEALFISNSHYPSLIITDVMMPRMDGVELCSRLKNNLQTCLIPVVMLTAKAMVENQIEGIESGADAYISKPFDLRIIKATVRNLIKKAEQIQELSKDNTHFQQGIKQKLKDKETCDLFAKFVDLVERNLSNPDFSVDFLSAEMGLNRTKLYSTIKDITEMTLGQYILKLRLERAANLLSTTNMTVTEVVFNVGIESPSYFTRAFKTQFGISPSSFKNKYN
ncbi:hybrid sensor histidine kinase/response regulator transcription factor [Bacteroides sp. 51]|uniref:hybrid sensor histidine kinase/response regulator transcription factor n=1 Tax=Bacteroides sp. 51 TaxID=2302938 RepID=UPI0013D81F87|nr:hybrid sensor histidine kinase/response regulator transcription factor [Bacteroides sp. 51]NDV84117.1 response regulator [Bacteroides sp. 51]